MACCHGSRLCECAEHRTLARGNGRAARATTCCGAAHGGVGMRVHIILGVAVGVQARCFKCGLSTQTLTTQNQCTQKRIAMLIGPTHPLQYRRHLCGVTCPTRTLTFRHRASHPCAPPGSSMTGSQPVQAGQELDDAFTGLADAEGMMSVAGFGSLLSERSAKTTFPNLINFRLGRVSGCT